MYTSTSLTWHMQIFMALFHLHTWHTQSKIFVCIFSGVVRGGGIGWGFGSFAFLILSYQNACYGCKNAENRTWSNFFFTSFVKKIWWIFQTHLWFSFIFGTQIKIFLWNWGSFWPCIESNTTDTFKAQKGKDIAKIVHVTSVVQATKITFVCKETKIMTLFKKKIIFRVRLTRRRRNCWIKSLF